MKNILILGGSGFVGSQLAKRLKSHNPKASILAIDNLKRRGSELNLADFKKLGIDFSHADIRVSSDLFDLSGNFDLVIDCSAEPSVLAGLNSAPNYLLQTNLMGTLNVLEFVRQRAKKLLFLSTSRVYSIQPLTEIKLNESESRFDANAKQEIAGVNNQGISEIFPTHLARSLYGASKLCSEQLIQEYNYTYGTETLINRCGVIAGPGQFGKTDQGVFTLWVAKHFFKGQLTYTGFGGQGKQVRDLLHPEDLFDLVVKQINDSKPWKAETYNVGGGLACSTSLKELTQLAIESTGNKISIESKPTTTSVDIPWYVTDSTKASKYYQWSPKHTAKSIVGDITNWIRENQRSLEPLFMN